jgi:hypothetical protein
MGTAREPTPVKYFAALLSSDDELLAAIEADLGAILGDVDLRSASFSWSFSDFYAEEMGAALLRRFVSFTPLGSPENLASIKSRTQSLEERYRNEAGGRRINLDPGYLDAYKVALASTKNAGQRIYLRDGIYAEATLLFHNAGFHGLEYTYRDYLTPETLEFFSALRARYLAQLREQV